MAYLDSLRPSRNSNVAIHMCCMTCDVWHEQGLGNVQGTIPADWGSHGAFQQLAKLTLSFNPQLSGSLPQAWGLNNTSLRKLQVLEVNNCNLTGTLPAAWSAQLPALRQVNASSNYITGCPSSSRACPLTCPHAPRSAPHKVLGRRHAQVILPQRPALEWHPGYDCRPVTNPDAFGAGTLPPQWASLDFAVINLDRNALTGVPVSPTAVLHMLCGSGSPCCTACRPAYQPDVYINLSFRTS